MRVVHLSFSGDGGAGRAARRASQACREVGLESEFLVAVQPSWDDGDIELSRYFSSDDEEEVIKSFEGKVQWEYLAKDRIKEGASLVSIAYPGLDIMSLSAIKSAQIVHLHWVSWMAPPPVIKELLDSGKKVFWTFHDQWPMTGGCHYASGCEQYKTGCRNCEQLNDEWALIPASFNDKQLSYGGKISNLTVVCPSKWLAECARKSKIFHDSNIEVVRNPIDIDAFSPNENRELLRRAYGVGPTDIVFLFGNFDNSEHRKGGALLQQVLDEFCRSHLRHHDGDKKMKFWIFGRGGDIFFSGLKDVECRSLGQVDNDEVLVDIYNIADLLLFPSTEDNYPNTILEAAACGTPAIGFDIGGVSEMITDSETGYIVEAERGRDGFLEAIYDFIGRPEADQAEMRSNCRSGVEKTNAYKTIGAELLKLYGAVGVKDNEVPLDLRRRASSLKHIVSVPASTKIGKEISQFPFWDSAQFQMVAGGCEAEKINKVWSLQPDKFSKKPENKLKLLSSRIFHAHHSAYSGPYQFLRHFDPDEVWQRELNCTIGQSLIPSDGWHLQESVRSFTSPAVQGNSVVGDFRLLQEVLNAPYDVVHIIDGELNGMLLVSALKKFKDAGIRVPKLVATLHQPKFLLEDYAPSKVMECYDGIIALCQDQANYLKSRFPDQLIETIPHGISTEFFTPDFNKDYISEPLTLLTVGHWLRDYATLVAAADIIYKLRPNITFNIVCHNWDETLNVPPNVNVLSNLSDGELKSLYESSHALCLPLIDATANNTLLEALASGLAIISTNVGGVPEAVNEDCAILVEPKDITGIVGAIETIDDNRVLLKKMSKQSRLQAESFDWQTIANLHLNFYRRLVRAPMDGLDFLK